MPISFACGCGKQLRAGDALAGKRTKCPVCGTVLTIPQPEPEANFGDELPPGLEPDAPGTTQPEQAEPEGYALGGLSNSTASIEPSSSGGDDYDLRPSVYHAAPMRERSEWDEPPPTRPKRSASSSASHASTSAKSSSLREYAYWLLLLPLIPLCISLVIKDEKQEIGERIEATLDAAAPEEQERARTAVEGDGIKSLDDLLHAMPGDKLIGAHLARSTFMHWVYAAVSIVLFLALIMIFFPVEPAQPVHLLAVGLFTGTIGILFLLAVQFCAQFRGVIRGRFPWFIWVIIAIIWFIGWSYDSAQDPESNFFLSAIGYTFGVGLCEELTKALPLLFYFKRHAQIGWRGACMWGLASGIGFGVSEGIMYSSRYYNGISGIDMYLIRFLSCVALHAIWAGSGALSLVRNQGEYEDIASASDFGLFALRILIVPMVLHGLYDTLLQKDMEVWALLISLLSFGWLAFLIESTRSSNLESKTRRPAYGY